MYTDKTDDKKAYICLDYDGCGEVLNFIQKNEPNTTPSSIWIEPLIRLIAQMTQDYRHLILGIGSRRQCAQTEAYNAEHKKNGYCSDVYSNPLMLETLKETLNQMKKDSGQAEIHTIEFAKFMLGDYQNNLEVGTCFTESTIHKKPKHCSITDPSKRLLLFTHLHWAAHRYSNLKHVVFIDDLEKSILQTIQYQFDADRQLIPAGVTLQLGHYRFTPTRRRGKTFCRKSQSKGCFPPIEGQGRLIPEKPLRLIAADLLKADKQVIDTSQTSLHEAQLNNLLNYLSLLATIPNKYVLAKWDLKSYSRSSIREALWHLQHLIIDIKDSDSDPSPALERLLDCLQTQHKLDDRRRSFYRQVIFTLASSYVRLTPADSPSDVKAKVTASSALGLYHTLFAALVGNIDLEIVFARSDDQTSTSIRYAETPSAKSPQKFVSNLARNKTRQAATQLTTFFELLERYKKPSKREIVNKLMANLKTLPPAESERNVPYSPLAQAQDYLQEALLAESRYYTQKPWLLWTRKNATLRPILKQIEHLLKSKKPQPETKMVYENQDEALCP